MVPKLSRWRVFLTRTCQRISLVEVFIFVRFRFRLWVSIVTEIAAFRRDGWFHQGKLIISHGCASSFPPFKAPIDNCEAVEKRKASHSRKEKQRNGLQLTRKNTTSLSLRC